MRRHINCAAAIAVGCAVAAAPPASAHEGTPAFSPPKAALVAPAVGDGDPAGRSESTPPETVKALVVQSWSGCTSDEVLWQAINDTWMDLGSMPVEIDYDNQPACFGEVTYDDLVASGADVLILDNVAGIQNDLSKPAKQAIKRYARDGHGVVSTFLTFRYHDTSNRSLQPLMGVHARLHRNAHALTPSYTELEPDSPLFARLGDPYVSVGYPFAQVPRDDSWDADDLTPTARYVAKSADDQGAIIVNEEPSMRSVYISSMPEYHGGADDRQFLYNAITYVAAGTTTAPTLDESLFVR